ncbi:MAG TPA: NCS1 family nucleobase:cation symporter-1 [Candidatus Acidoferrales bacterium]|jgi:nucleobase:cation symporter-1, NCS1 family|nr:NCS1 family nucleobase:cation symporter-1 [Candidatus Acidoferrales bacterium]
MTAALFEEIVQPDGRHELKPEVDAALGDSPLHNADLAPVPVAKRTWTTYNYVALWIGMAHNIPTWGLAAGLVAIGMAWYQAIFTIMLANVIVLVPMLLNSHAGTKYGIPFPVFARASFGVYGANLAALIRAGIACGWFGIQTWIGGGALYTVMGAIFGKDSWWLTASKFQIGFGDPQPWTLWLSFAVFWAANIFIILNGMDFIRRFENWAAPFVLVVAFFLLAWMTIQAGGFGPLVEDHGTLGWGSNFWLVFWPSLMGMIAFWSTLSLNMPDFTRFGKSQRTQAIGQALGLPTTMTVFPLIAVLVTSATKTVYGDYIWDPVALVGRFGDGSIGGVVVVVLALFTLAIATLSVNVAANIVSPSYDFSNAWPKRISFRTGGLITGILGILIQPWMLLSSPEVYIFTWLGFYGGATGAIAGVLIADYWLIRRTDLRLADLYRTTGVYRYTSGWNWRAVVSLALGAFVALGGAYSVTGADGKATGPFPPGGIVGFLHVQLPWGGYLYDYSWILGLVVSFVAYWAFTKFVPQRESVAEAAAQPV